MKKTMTALALIALLATTGCSGIDRAMEEQAAYEANPPVESLQFRGKSIAFDTITTPDGRTVECVGTTGGYMGGLSCDWANAKTAKKVREK